MSYNIDTWKTKKLENLTIPINSFYKHPRTDWHPEQPKIIDVGTMEIELELGEGMIKGFLKDGIIQVNKIELIGEGSGTLRKVLDGALEESKGELESILIWEGGDSITKLKVKDGIISEEQIEL